MLARGAGRAVGGGCVVRFFFLRFASKDLSAARRLPAFRAPGSAAWRPLTATASPIGDLFPTNRVASGRLGVEDGRAGAGGSREHLSLLALGVGRRSSVFPFLQPTHHHLPTADHSIFVGDLAPDVTDLVLQETFRQFFPSVRSAKVIADPATARSRGYGFVRFGDGGERDAALVRMQGHLLSDRAIRVSVATAKKGSVSRGGGEGGRERTTNDARLCCSPTLALHRTPPPSACPPAPAPPARAAPPCPSPRAAWAAAA